MWPFPKRSKLRAVPDAPEHADDTSDDLRARLRRVEADLDDLYDRMARLAGRHARRAQRDGRTESDAPADGASAVAPKPNGHAPSIAQLRAAGRWPFTR